MIVLHKTAHQNKSEDLEERLNNLVISFKMRIHENEDENLPFIEEDGQEMRSNEEIEKWFQDLEMELKILRSISGDGCYIDPKTKKIC